MRTTNRHWRSRLTRKACPQKATGPYLGKQLVKVGEEREEISGG